MIEKLKLLFIRFVLHRTSPVLHLAEWWEEMRGYRTQALAVAALVVFEMNRYHFGMFANDELTKQVLTALGGSASMTLVSKFQRWQAYLDEAAKVVQESTPQPTKEEPPK